MSTLAEMWEATIEGLAKALGDMTRRALVAETALEKISALTLGNGTGEEIVTAAGDIARAALAAEGGPA